MLDIKITEQTDSIEKYFCEPFSECKKYPMNNDDTIYLMNLVLSDNKDFEIPNNEKPFLYNVIESRLDEYTFKITDKRVLLFLVAICHTPGVAVMYITYLQYWSKKNDCREIDLTIFCGNIFPFGFINEDDLNRLWDLQKVKCETGSDNLLDYKKARLSIQFN